MTGILRKMVSKLVKSELDMSGRRGDRERGRCSSDDVSRPIAPSPTRPLNSMSEKCTLIVLLAPCLVPATPG